MTNAHDTSLTVDHALQLDASSCVYRCGPLELDAYELTDSMAPTGAPSGNNTGRYAWVWWLGDEPWPVRAGEC